MDSPEPRRSIQDIIPPARSRPIRVPPPTHIGAQLPPTPPPDSFRERRAGPWTYIFVALVVIVILGAGIGVMSTVFHRAYVSVSPYHFEFPLQTQFQASPGGALSYETISIEDSLSKTVPATGSIEASDRASGKIVVYNAYSTKSQRLITNTRFATPAGLIYRIHEPIVIPGYTTKAGVKVPGEIEVVVYADEAGDTYNIGLTDFTIPGLKGSDQYTLMTARSKTPMTGGFVGRRAIVDATLRAQTISELKAELDRSLREKIVTTVPEHTLIFPGTVSVVYAEAPDAVEGENAIIMVSASGYAAAFDEATLANEFARAGGVSYSMPLSVGNPTELAVLVDNPVNVQEKKPISLSVSGTARLTATFDAAQLAVDLAGKEEKDITMVRAGYSAIETMTVKVYPFWMGTIPTDATKVKVETVSVLDSES